MRLFLVLGLLLFLVPGCKTVLPEEPEVSNDYKVHSYYIVPADVNYNGDNASKVWLATLETQQWFQTASGGLTFEMLDEEEIIEVYYTNYPKEYYQEDWWSLLLAEMRENGEPVEVKGTVLMMWIEGVTMLGDESHALGGWSCNGDCGAAILPISSLFAPTRLPTNMGTVFHEMGHAFGLTHPVEQSDLPLSVEDEALLRSVMCQADLRTGTSNSEHGFLTSEKAALIKNGFLKPEVQTFQDIWSTEIINYPVLGPIPEPTIEIERISTNTVKFSSNIDDGLLYYWYFGDGNISNDPTPEYTFSRPSTYYVTLMVTNQNYMAARVSEYINLN